MTGQPFASILINNYNYGSFLKDAIDSALGQTYRSFEVIVVDDGSTDNSNEIIRGYGNRIIPVLKRNEGQASAFNEGFSASKGNIICLLDSDDVFLPNKLDLVASALHAGGSSVGWCFHPLQLVDSTLSYLEADTEALDIPRPLLHVDVRYKMRRGKLGEPFVIPATSGMCFTRACLKQIIPMPVSKSVSLNDSYIKFAAMSICKGVVISDCLALQRIHGKNLFTLRENNQTQQAEIFINTAYHIQKKFPATANFSDNLLATGLRLNRKVFDENSPHNTLAREYISRRPVSSRISIRLKQLLYQLREVLSD